MKLKRCSIGAYLIGCAAGILIGRHTARTRASMPLTEADMVLAEELSDERIQRWLEAGLRGRTERAWSAFSEILAKTMASDAHLKFREPMSTDGVDCLSGFA